MFFGIISAFLILLQMVAVLHRACRDEKHKEDTSCFLVMSSNLQAGQIAIAI